MLSKVAVGVAGAVFAAVTSAYVIWGPTKKRPKDQCPGLVNVGNSCFMNSLLQAWAACPSVYSWIHRVMTSMTQSQDEGILTSTIFKVMKVLNNEDETASDPYDPSQVFHALRAKRWVITSDEQDAHELFNVLTETLDEEASRYPGILSLFDIKHLQDPHNEYQDKHRACTRSKGLLPVLPMREIEEPTRGLLASQLQCLSCGLRSPVKYDAFDSLSLTIPRNYWGPLSLDSLLHQFIRPEIVQNVECAGCAKSAGIKSMKSNFRKKVSLGKLPQVLCIHLPRTQWMRNGALVKRFDHISFPDTLLMDRYVYSHAGAGDTKTRQNLLGGADLALLRPRPQTTPVVQPASSAPVNLLRTLHFDQQFTGTGLFLTSRGSPEIPRELSDINHNAPPEISTKLDCPPSRQPEFSYRLAAVVCHLGDVELGHFVTYRRGVHQGGANLKGAASLSPKWWLTSDSSVRRVSASQVFSSEAYMLFYERIIET
ncbi:ubiquitin carboxyl-terminal hydrolase 30-like [Plakobranchus ocellatus]|uniref:Ubiquitin carboxyl-terminal hydrolase n=1 Tax=Plakobranchus ocellatus TaxID=259542 RepID=A0AAV3ZXB6_9GAST|nr:ubiquitin carboxyl-terminal hydrolase 30-like [Plakobranchus ocellatus]